MAEIGRALVSLGLIAFCGYYIYLGKPYPGWVIFGTLVIVGSMWGDIKVKM